ncbi:MAG: hypothetical protein P8Y97_07000 [Candidatus Lokiarchaeota archaeon]
MELLISIIWIIGAGLLGFLISGIFAGKLNLSRRIFLIPYILISLTFVTFYFLLESINIISLLIENWIWGILAGVIVGLFLIKNVLSQPSSRKSKGKTFVVDLLWYGVAYGITDALLLNILPVLAIWISFSSIGWTSSLFGVIIVAIFGLLASLFVTILYHIGYPEFRNSRLIFVLIGNTLITLAFIIPANPLGAFISHTVMHLAAVYRGPETTIQLPPHYK